MAQIMHRPVRAEHGIDATEHRPQTNDYSERNSWQPLHTLVVVVLFPMFALAVWRTPSTPHWPPVVEGAESERRRALCGQLLVIGLGGGLFVAGTVISTVGLTSVFVRTDLAFLGTSHDHLRSADEQLLPFIAHDRAGFGGTACPERVPHYA